MASACDTPIYQFVGHISIPELDVNLCNHNRVSVIANNRRKAMGMSQIRLFGRNIIVNSKDVLQLTSVRTFAAGGKSKKSKGGAAADAPKASILSKEVKSTTVVGANILKEGADPKVMADSEYPDWLWHLLDKHPPLSELRRKNVETLPYADLRRFVKLDTRAKIKENNSIKAKN